MKKLLLVSLSILVAAGLGLLLLTACEQTPTVTPQSWTTVLGPSTNNIGDVDVLTLPSSPSYIGYVTFTNSSIGVASLPSLISSAAYIGNVTFTNGTIGVSALPSLISGAGYIGNVTFTNGTIGVSSLPALPSSPNYVGYVTFTNASIGVASLPAISLGSGVGYIGSVTFTNSSIGVSSLPAISLGSGVGYIGNVTFTNSSIGVASLPAISLGSGVGYIGNVTFTNSSIGVASLPSLVSGAGYIGNVTVTQMVALPSSPNYVGNVTVTNSSFGVSSLPALVSGVGYAGYFTPTLTSFTVTNATVPVSISTGSNVIGKVTIDPTTPGTTDRVTTELITRTQQIPIITVGAYHAGDAVGGAITFTNASRTVGQGGTILSLILQDSDKESASLELWLFDYGFTASADNAVLDPVDADIGHSIGVIPISAADYNTGNDWGVATVRNVNLPYSTIAGTTIYGQLRCTGTPTYGNTGDLTVTLVLRWN